jgi:hypothetical protein
MPAKSPVTSPVKSIVFAAAIAAVTAYAPAAFGAGSPPRIDVTKVCKAGAGEITSLFGSSTQDVVGTCVQDEEAARDQLQQNWNDFPALAKTRCVQPKEYLPSYVEWTACLEMTRDVIKMRQERSASITGDYEDRECPIVKTNNDGDIIWVDTCPTGRGRSRHSSAARK